MICRINYDTELSPEERDTGKQPSIWAVLAATDGDLGALTTDTRWRRPSLRPGHAESGPTTIPILPAISAGCRGRRQGGGANSNQHGHPSQNPLPEGRPGSTPHEGGHGYFGSLTADHGQQLEGRHVDRQAEPNRRRPRPSGRNGCDRAWRSLPVTPRRPPGGTSPDSFGESSGSLRRRIRIATGSSSSEAAGFDNPSIAFRSGGRPSSPKEARMASSRKAKNKEALPKCLVRSASFSSKGPLN